MCGGSKRRGREAAERVSVEDGKFAVVGMFAVGREACAADDALSLKELPQRATAERRVEKGSKTLIRRHSRINDRKIKVVRGEG